MESGHSKTTNTGDGQSPYLKVEELPTFRVKSHIGLITEQEYLLSHRIEEFYKEKPCVMSSS